MGRIMKIFALMLLSVASCLVASAPAQSQVFDAPVPGVGRVKTEIGFAPGFDINQCETLGSFPAGEKISTPFSTYIIITRPEGGKTVRLSYDFKVVSPSNREEGHTAHSVWPSENTVSCWYVTTQNANEAGTYRYRFLINGVALFDSTVIGTERLA